MQGYCQRLTGKVRPVSTTLDFYPADELAEILRRSAEILGVPLKDDADTEIATRSRGALPE